MGLTFYDSYPSQYFTKCILETIKERKEKNIVRPDIIHLLMEVSEELSAKNGNSLFVRLKPLQPVPISGNTKKKQMSISTLDIVSQCIVFFFAGFQTVSTFLSFAIYELALNQDIQRKLREEIKKHAVNGKIPYETLQDMPYMDMVVTGK